MCGDCRRRYDVNPLRLLDCKNEPCQPFKAGAPQHRRQPLRALRRALHDDCEALLDDLGIEYNIDPLLVRGLDYYTRTAFEFQPKVEGAQSTLGGGGRYDGLIEQLGGRPTPAIGFGTGIERIILNLKRQELDVGAGRRPDAFIAVADEAAAGRAMQLAHELRIAGLSAVLGSPDAA